MSLIQEKPNWLQAETTDVAARAVTDRQTHKASTVTLAAHACQGLKMAVPRGTTYSCAGVIVPHARAPAPTATEPRESGIPQITLVSG